MKILLASLFDNVYPKKFAKGELLLYEGDTITKFYTIVSGFVKVYTILNEGTERIIFIYGPGDAFPLTSILTQGNTAHYFYHAMTDVELLIMPTATFIDKMKNNLEAVEKIVQYTNDVNDQFLQRINTLAVNDARRKIVALLAFLSLKTGTPGAISHIGIPLTHQDMADMSGLTRETASVQLMRLKREKVLSGNRSLSINVAKLEALKSKLAINL